MKATPFLLAALLSSAASSAMSQDAKSPAKGVAPAFKGATAWLNSKPLTADDLGGKVVLVEFLTYTCINWLRTMPYVRAWAAKYKDRGLVVVGVHTPEFPFEHDLDNVRRALKEMQIAFPIAVDNDYAVWGAFRNQAWPALYFIDAKGRIRHQHDGEGEYDSTERMIQQLLAEAESAGASDGLVSPEGRGTEAAADWENLRSGENYLGSERTENFASPRGAGREYAVPARLALNQWGLAGDWTVKPGSVVLNKASGRIAYRFHARDVHLVMGPASRGATVRFRVLIDGKPPGAAHGADVDEQGNGAVSSQRLYQLIRQPNPIIDRTFEIEFLEKDVEGFAFTFG
jgi:thiol-disulfide isomerase/thioredoxin